jgi:hypothetical protein
MNLLPLLSKCPKRPAAIVGGAVVLWLLCSATPMLGLQVCLMASVLAYFLGRAALVRMLVRPRVEKQVHPRSLRGRTIGAAVGASVLAIGAEHIMPGTFFSFFRSAVAASVEVSPKVDTLGTASQAVTSYEPLTVPLASSLSIDASLLVVVVLAILVGRFHFISVARTLRDKLKDSTRSPHGLAILALLALGAVAVNGSRAPTAIPAPSASAAAPVPTDAEKRATLEEQLAEKLASLRKLETPLQGATAANATNTTSLDDMNLWRNTSRPNPAELETLRADIHKIAKELGSLGS